MARLRTTTGCFACRKRRKKCDEHKPRCSGCIRQDLDCIWPAVGGHPTRYLQADNTTKSTMEPVFADDSSRIGLVRSAVYGLPGITTSTDHYLYQYLRERFLPQTLRDDAHPTFRDWDPIIIVGAENACAMAAYLATAAMHASWNEPKYKPIARRYYNNSVVAMKNALADKNLTGAEGWLIHTTTWLMLFEIGQGWNTGHNALGATPHLHGLARILMMRISTNCKTRKSAILPQDRLTAESFLLWISTLSLFYSDIDSIVEYINWDDLSIYLEADVFRDGSGRASAPLLSSDWKLHRIIFEIACLSHKAPLDDLADVRGLGLEEELRRQEEHLHLDVKASVVNKQIFQQTRLYILAGRILIFKALRPTSCVSHAGIRTLVADAMAIVRGLSIGQAALYYLWPISLLSCAIETEEDAFLLDATFEKIWHVSYCGEVHRARTAVHTLRQKVANTSGIHLLDVLIFPGGLFKHPWLESQWGRTL